MIMVMMLMVMMIRAVNNRQAACHRSQRGRTLTDADMLRWVFTLWSWQYRNSELNHVWMMYVGALWGHHEDVA